MTRVVHCKKENYDILIDRRTKYGNPFIVGLDGDRAQVIEMYHEWITSNDELMADLYELEGKILGCWCAPDKDCHGRVLLDLLQDKFGGERVDRFNLKL